MKRILELDPSTYQRHAIHTENRAWAETNCYSDVILELVHTLGHEPIAALPFTLRIDFEGDQWTFFKFPHGDLLELYGLDVQELAIWRPLARQVEEQVELGRFALVELDSYYLPDTAGSAYKLARTKSTVAVNEIDIAGRKLGYFHNQGYFRLEGQDFEDVFQLNGLAHERMLPPYVEYVKRDHELPKRSGAELAAASTRILRTHVRLLPRANPFEAFKRRFARDLEWLLGDGIEAFHAYSFATLRQFGACFELSETYFRWLAAHGRPEAEELVSCYGGISQSAKALQFQLARAIARKKPLELAALDSMGAQWERARGLLVERFS